MELSDVLFNLAIEAPSVAVGRFAIWRISLALMKLAEALDDVAKSAVASADKPPAMWLPSCFARRNRTCHLSVW